MSTRTPLTRRVIALLILPCFSAACTSWQPLRVSNLRDTMREYEPDRIQLILGTRSFGGKVVLSNPQVYGDAPRDTIRGILQDTGQVGIAFSDVLGASFPTHAAEKTGALVGGGFLIAILIACSFSECLQDPF